MTIYKDDNFIEHWGNGITTNFPYAFFIPDEDSVRVYILSGGVETEVPAGFYSITGLGGDESGGMVTYPIIEPVVPITSSEKLRIERVTSLTQEVIFSDQTRYNASAHQVVSDKLTVMILDMWDRLRRTPAGVITGFRDLVFPQPEPNTFLMFDGAGELVTQQAEVDSLVTSVELDTYEAVAAYTRPAGVTSIGVRGGTVKGDGYGGLYILDPADVASAHNPPAILVTLNGSRFKRADSAKQLTVSDAIAGKQLMVGAFGLGEAGAVPLLASLNTTTTPTGFYRTTAAGTVGSYPAGSGDGILLVERFSATAFKQTWMGVGSDAEWVRYYNGAFGSWRRRMRADEFTSFGLDMINETDAADARGLLGLGSAALMEQSALLSTGTLGFPTAQGIGGQVTQATSKTTAVTINKMCGAIIMAATSIAGSARFTFTVNNNLLAINDQVLVTSRSTYFKAEPYNLNAGSFVMLCENISSSAQTEQGVLNFMILKGTAD